MDFNLSEQEKMLQGLAREFAVKEVMSRAAEIDRSGEFPFDMAKEIGGRGFQGLPFPVEYGGSGAGYTSYVLVMEQICQSSVTVVASVREFRIGLQALFHGGQRQCRFDMMELAISNADGHDCHFSTRILQRFVIVVSRRSAAMPLRYS